MSKTLIVLLTTFIALALAWNAIIPPYENLDEIEHAEVVRYIATTGQLPIHESAAIEGYHVKQEASQPPLYHILAAGWMRLWGLAAAPHPFNPLPGYIVECGPTDTFYNKANWTRDPYRTDLNTTRTIHGLRLFSTLLQTLTVAGAWTLARRVFPTGPVPMLTTALVAFNPQFLLISAGVNNDNVITPLATWGMIFAYDLWDKGPSMRRVLGFGVLSGLAGLSKLSGLGVLGLGGLALLIRAVQRKTPFVQLLKWWVLITLPVILITAPWFLRNLALYDDPTALAPMLEKVGRREGNIDFRETKIMWLSYWGQMPCSFYHRALYWPYTAILIIGIAGVLLFWRRFTSQQKTALMLASIWFIVIVIAWIRWNSITPAPGGRLLFPAIAALALILAAGVRNCELGVRDYVSRHIKREASIVNRALRVVFRAVNCAVLLPLWAMVTLRAGPMVMFTPPPRLSADASVVNPQDIAFGETLYLRGYEVEVRDPAWFLCRLADRTPCTPELDVILYWQASAPISDDYVMALQLVSPVPGETDLRLNYNHWLGRGNLPTSAIPVGPILRDHYRIPLPASDTPTQAWMLQIAFTEPKSNIRLPVSINDTPVGDAAQLKLLRIPAPVIPPHSAHPQAHFGDHAVVLFEALVHSQEDDLRIELWWGNRELFSEDYTVFVHAYAADGTLLATGDSPPMRGHFPTSLWKVDDLIIDEHTLTLPQGPSPAYIAVGLYHPTTGERLPASPQNARVENNAAIIWEAQP